MAVWPDLTEYHGAMQHPDRSLLDDELRRASIEQDRFGMPKPATGGNAVVYKASLRKDVWAVRCFLRPISDHAERYAAIARHLAKVRGEFATRFEYLEGGIRVKGERFPVVKMQWVQGQPLDRCVEAALGKPRELAALAERWRALVRDLEAAKVAHRDLQHGNVLVRGKDLLLIDYDGMWVPSLAGRKATEIGHRAYQHPRRTEDHYGPWLDRFSALVVFVSLAALVADPGLWERYNNGDNLVFVREDFQEPGRSAVWGDVAALGKPELTRLAGVLAACAQRDPEDVPPLEAILARPGKVKAVALAPAAAPAAAKARWTSGPPKGGGTALQLAPRWRPIWARPGERVEVRWKRETRDVPLDLEHPAEVLAPDWARALALAAAGIAAGAALGLWVSPALGLVAAGGGLAATRAVPPRRRRIAVRERVVRPQEEQVRAEAKVTAPGHRSAVMALQCTADGRRLLAVTRLGECGLWEVPEDRWAAGALRLPPFEQAALAQGAARLALATERAALVFDLAQGKRTEHAGDAARRLRAVALTPDGSRLALGFDPPLLRVVEVATRKVIAEVPSQGTRVAAVAFAADGQALAYGTGSGAVRVVRLGPKPEPLAEHPSHRLAITALAASPDGERFASGDDSGLVTIWGSDGKRRASATVPGRGVRSLCFAGDDALVAGCGDGSVRVLDARSAAVAAACPVGSGAVTALAWAAGKMALAAGTAAGRVALLAVED